jgi:hypothetical protein
MDANYTLTEFKIQAPDDIAPYGGRFDGGPSRPPSRISNNKFARGKISSLTFAYTGEADYLFNEQC